MKQFLVLVMILLLAVSPALAEIDLSNMSTEELIALRQQINELLNEDNTIYSGDYTVGVNIKAGQYKFTCTSIIESSNWVRVLVYPSEDTYKPLSTCDVYLGETMYLDLKDGMVLTLSNGYGILETVAPNWAP